MTAAIPSTPGASMISHATMGVRRFRKKPVVVEAMQFNDLGDYTNIVHWMQACGDSTARANDVTYSPPVMRIPTLEGVMIANPGDWIVRGTSGEFYPVKPDIFADVYEYTNDIF